MQIRNTSQSYGLISIVLHWFMAVALIALFALGVYMVGLNYLDPWYKTAPYIHKSVGLVLLFMLVLRLMWRLSNPLPAIFGVKLEKMLALLVHRLHYLWMLTVMVSGYLIATADGRAISVFNWFEVPAIWAAEKGREDWAGMLHMYLAWGFMFFILLHAAAALKHHFVDKDRTLLRMLGSQRCNEAKEKHHE